MFGRLAFRAGAYLVSLMRLPSSPDPVRPLSAVSAHRPGLTGNFEYFRQVQLPRYVRALPIPDSLDGFAELSGAEWIQLLAPVFSVRLARLPPLAPACLRPLRPLRMRRCVLRCVCSTASEPLRGKTRGLLCMMLVPAASRSAASSVGAGCYCATPRRRSPKLQQPRCRSQLLRRRHNQRRPRPMPRPAQRASRPKVRRRVEGRRVFDEGGTEQGRRAKGQRWF